MFMYIPHRLLQEHVCLDRTLAIGYAKEDSKPQEFQEFQVSQELSVVDFPPEQQGTHLGNTTSMDALTRSFESAIRGNQWEKDSWMPWQYSAEVQQRTDELCLILEKDKRPELLTRRKKLLFLFSKHKGDEYNYRALLNYYEAKPNVYVMHHKGCAVTVNMTGRS